MVVFSHRYYNDNDNYYNVYVDKLMKVLMKSELGCTLVIAIIMIMIIIIMFM